MTRKAITVEFVIPTAFATALAIIFCVVAVYFTDKYLGPIDPTEANHSVAGNGRNAELPSRDGRLTRVRLLLQ